MAGSGPIGPRACRPRAAQGVLGGLARRGLILAMLAALAPVGLRAQTPVPEAAPPTGPATPRMPAPLPSPAAAVPETTAVAPPVADSALDPLSALDREQKLEASGDLAGAEALLHGILTRDPGSLSALISLERLLRLQGRLAELIPSIRALLRQDPTSPIGYQMLIRTYSALDRLPDLAQAGEDWIHATPRLETPYREIAAVYRARHDPQSALKVLQRGRARIGRPEALAFELGDLYASLGDVRDAALEWGRAVGNAGEGFNLVQMHVANLPDGGAALLPLLVEQLTRSPTTPARERGAAFMALDAGLGQQAERIVQRVASSLQGPQLQGFLVEVARRADGARLPGLAYWAYTQILAGGGPEAEMLAVRSRLAELALAVGDTAAAERNYAVLERASAMGSPARRQALALRVELASRSGDADGAERDLARFRQEYPSATELDVAAAAVANARLAAGDVAGAARVLDGIKGPHSSFVLGRLELQRGNVAEARNALLAAAAGLQGSDATEAIALVSLLGRLSAEGCQLLGKGEALAQEGKRKEAIDLLQQGSTSFPDAERAAILDYAAGIADHAGMAAQAELLRRLIVTSYPRALETPGALLALGRALAERPAGAVEAREFLERLIVDYPQSALVPEARRQLDLLQADAPRS